MIIRAANSLDMTAVGIFGARLLALHHEIDPKRFVGGSAKTPETYSRYLGEKLSENNSVILVASEEGMIAGYVWGGIEGSDYMALRGPAGVVYDLFVDDAHRRQGVGRNLLEAAVQWLKEHGAQQVLLSTAYKNDDAQRLFVSAGFRSTMVELTRDM